MQFNNFNNNDNNRFIITFFILFIALFSIDYFIGQGRNTDTTQTIQKTETKIDNVQENTKSVLQNRNEGIKTAKVNYSYIKLQNASMRVKINLHGGLIESVKLKKYNEVAISQPGIYPQAVELLSQPQRPYYISIIYKGGSAIADDTSNWQRSPTDSNSLELRSDALTFKRTFLLDKNKVLKNTEDDYTITIIDKVTNTGNKPLSVSKSIGVFRKDPQIYNYAVVHEGAVINTEHTVKEIKYNKIKNGERLSNSQWFGFTDKYWLCAILNQTKNTAISMNSNATCYRLSTEDKQILLNPGDSSELVYTVFVGPKDINVLNQYAEKLNLDKFDRAIDFGWFFLITKPLTQFMGWLSSVIPNMGIVILLLTLLFRFLTYPLMKKSFVSIARMKTIQPRIAMLQKMYANDKLRLNQELVEIYRRERISPLSGCLPMFLQAPIFFCLYKVFFISISMRHAPLFGWVNDLSEPDMCYITNLFGLINWTPPGFLQIGIWPLIMGATMLVQQRITSTINKVDTTNETPEQKAQRKMMYFMPIFFTYVSISFPVSVILYWTISNIIGILQQQYVMKKINKV